MNSMIEQQIWDYIDGTCSEQERYHIESLIETDPIYKAAYQELTAINNDFSLLDTDEPSMSFTRNLMDKVKLEPVPGSLKSLIDKRIIYGIAAFFLISIAALLVVVFANITWSEPGTNAFSEITLPKVNYSSYINSTVINCFYIFDLVIGLYFLDSLLSKKLNHKKG
ncbi:MAG: hypothetical protein JWN56_2637 [Sphingobacteriales bacterium]|nr:hypothetical protein [Sphingobacteriales bacterium]